MRKFASIWEVTPETAHPRAKEIVGKSVIWKYGDEDSPLGNDIGADTFAAYLTFRASRPAGGVEDFIRQQITSRGFSDANWDQLDTARLKDLLTANGGVALLRRDDFIIGLAFAQLLLEGTTDSDVRRRAITALCRQATDVVLSFRGGGGESARKKQLAEFRRILESE